MPKTLGQSYLKVKINQTLCPVLTRIFFQGEKWALLCFFFSILCCSKSLLPVLSCNRGDKVMYAPKRVACYTF